MHLPRHSASRTQSREEGGKDEVGGVNCSSLEPNDSGVTRSAQVTERGILGSETVPGRDAERRSRPLFGSGVVVKAESLV